MKKIVSMMLSALLLLSLAACGDKNNASGDKPAAPTSALNILETVPTVRTRSLPLPAAISPRPTPARTLPASST